MMVVNVFAQDAPHVTLAEDDRMVEALAPNATYEPFDIRALPRRARRRETCWMPSPATRRLKYAPQATAGTISCFRPAPGPFPTRTPAPRRISRTTLTPRSS